MNATTTRHPFQVSAMFTVEDSSAIRQLELVPSSEGNDAYDVMISYHSTPDKVYRFAVENDATAQRWYDLLTDSEARSMTSWGYEVNHAKAHGDIELV